MVALALTFVATPVAAVPSAVDATAPPAEHPCGERNAALCGTIEVPLDRADPSAGTIGIGYERYPHTDTAAAPRETIVAVEGGPGYATTASRGSYLGLFRPMLALHDLLLVDLRGTGTSEPIDCRPLQDLRLPDYDRWVQAVGRCGRQLGPASDLYGTANAADDLADVLDALAIDRIDLYGDSYGTFFSQTFAVRHPDRLRSLVLDAAYPVEGADPWWRDLARAAADGVRFVCGRDPGCAAVGGDPLRRLVRLDRRLAREPITGVAPNADGKLRRVTIDPGILAYVYTGAGYSPTVYRELDAAIRAALAPDPDPSPLLRLARENVYLGAGGAPRYYSQGLANAASCNDYPQLYDMLAPPSERPEQYLEAVRLLERDDPDAFEPFTVQEWITSPVQDLDSCMRWPVPDRPLPPLRIRTPIRTCPRSCSSVISTPRPHRRERSSWPRGSRTRRTFPCRTWCTSPPSATGTDAHRRSCSGSCAPSRPGHLVRGGVPGDPRGRRVRRPGVGARRVAGPPGGDGRHGDRRGRDRSVVGHGGFRGRGSARRVLRHQRLRSRVVEPRRRALGA